MERKIKVMISGLPGKVAYPIAEAVATSGDMELLNFGLTGPEIDSTEIIVGGVIVKLFTPDEKDLLLTEFVYNNRPDVVIDFTAPVAVQGNVDFYTNNKLPFVMGTTFGDFVHLPEYIRDKVAQSMINAIVAANMAKDIVVVQAMFEFAAKSFPGAFKDFRCNPVESHQSTKGDTSGTAKAIVASLQTMGVDCSIDKIEKKRTEADYEALGIPKEHWNGHGWHTYPLIKDDANVFLSFTHNINGRQPYIDGTLDAVRFLFNKMDPAKQNIGHVFSMIDVLEGN